MLEQKPFTIVNVGYRSTNYWVISAGAGRFLIDIGWPGTLREMKANLKRKGVPLDELRYAIATHYHIDHAGLAEELKHEGIPLLVVDFQIPAIPIMKTWIKPEDNYTDITADGNLITSLEQSRDLLDDIGIPGQIFSTPGHSDHCISVLLDDGSAFTGDLPPEAFCWDNPKGLESWQLLRSKGAEMIYPGHGPIRPMDVGPPI
jgi:ribonuclease/clavin/mitogillin